MSPPPYGVLHSTRTKTDYGGVPLKQKTIMEVQKEENLFTVQEVITPVPAASVDPLTSHVSSISLDHEPPSPTGVNALASVVVVNVSSANIAKSKNKEEESEEPRGSANLTQPLETGGGSDSDSDPNENVNTTVLANSTKDEVNKMVEKVSEGMAKLTTKKKQLSGAQRRKLKKMNLQGKMAAAQDAPKVSSESPSTSAEAGKRVRSPEEQNSVKPPKKKKGSPPSSKLESPSQTSHKGGSSQNPLGKGDKGDPNTKKVRTATELSEKVGDSQQKTQSTRKRKVVADKGKEPPSYAKVARRQNRDELCYAVIDTSSASGKIPPDQHSNVEDLVNNKIVEHVLGSDNALPIKIMSCEFKGDMLMMRLASSECIDILKELVDSIPSPWDGAKLKLVRKMDIPQLTKATVYIKGWGSKYTSKRILGLFGHQNKGLEVEKWEVFHREEDPEGTLLVVGLDQVSMDSLAETKGMAFFVSKAVYFKIGKARVGEDNPRNKPTQGGSVEENSPPQPNDQGAETTISDSQEARLLEDS